MRIAETLPRSISTRWLPSSCWPTLRAASIVAETIKPGAIGCSLGEVLMICIGGIVWCAKAFAAQGGAGNGDMLNKGDLTLKKAIIRADSRPKLAMGAVSVGIGAGQGGYDTPCAG